MDVALLDVRLGAHTVYPVADTLEQFDIPLAFATADDVLWPGYETVPRLRKPSSPS